MCVDVKSNHTGIDELGMQCVYVCINIMRSYSVMHIIAHCIADSAKEAVKSYLFYRCMF